MGILEHVKVLETKVDKEIDLAKRLVDENTQLKEKVEIYQRRIEDLEALIHAFKEEQVAIENGILSALNRLNQFEDAVEKSLSSGLTGQEAPESTKSVPDDGEEVSINEPQAEGKASVTNSASESNRDQPPDEME
jgi:predicted nuclease with TOPRIM domain